MDKIAIISGVYGDLNSLLCVLSDMEHKGVNRIYSLGNSIKAGEMNSECLYFISSRCSVALMGDKEEGLGILEKSDDYNISDLNFISKLPFSHEFYMSGRLIRLFNDNPYNSFIKDDYKTKKEEKFKPSIRTGTSFADIVICSDNNGVVEETIDSKVLIGVPNVSDKGMYANYLIIEGDLDSYNFAPISFQHVKIPVPSKVLTRASFEETSRSFRKLYENRKESN